MKPNPMEVKGIDLNKIRNRNEKRVVKFMTEILDEYYSDYIFEQLDIEDIFALTLNLLPARYVQKGTIILQDRISDFEIKSKVREATERVLENPTRQTSSKIRKKESPRFRSKPGVIWFDRHFAADPRLTISPPRTPGTLPIHDETTREIFTD